MGPARDRTHPWHQISVNSCKLNVCFQEDREPVPLLINTVQATLVAVKRHALLDLYCLGIRPQAMNIAI
jgi:hypothetical protein